MNEQTLIGCCGLVCSNCEGYLATRANDEAWKERLAAHAREAYGQQDATTATVTCDGCQAGGRLCSYCHACEIRACAAAQGVPHCAACRAFESCARIHQFMEMVPETAETFAILTGRL